MTVCFFGIYDPAYARNRVLMEGLRANGVQIIECRVDPKERRGFAKYRALFWAARSLRQRPIDIVLVAFPGHSLVWLARFIFPRPLIVFDAFLSLYDSNVFDRKTHRPHSLRALGDRFLDWFGCRLADRVLLDTEAHIDYFVRMFRVRREKCIRVWIGADSLLFHPRPEAFSETFTVHFHGSFIPLQGVEYILEAAKALERESIRFRLVGQGQEYDLMRARADALGLRNVEFVGKVPLERVPDYAAASHVCLGIFGDTEKTQRVIPNKVFECMAMGMPIVTADTPAVRELAIYGALPFMLVPVADGIALAAAIGELARDAKARATLGREAGAFFERHLRAKQIVADLLERLPPGALRAEASSV